MATKLLQWLTAFVLFVSVWSSLVFDLVPVNLDDRIRDILWPLKPPQPLPFHHVILRGGLNTSSILVGSIWDAFFTDRVACKCYSLATIGYRVATFNDCEDAAEELKQEIIDARNDLKKKGFKFS